MANPFASMVSGSGGAGAGAATSSALPGATRSSSPGRGAAGGAREHAGARASATGAGVAASQAAAAPTTFGVPSRLMYAPINIAALREDSSQELLQLLGGVSDALCHAACYAPPLLRSVLAPVCRELAAFTVNA